MEKYTKYTKHTIRFYLKHIGRYKGAVIGMLALLTVSVIMSMIWPIALGKFFDTLATPGDKELIAKTLFMVLGIILLIEIINISGWQGFKILNIKFQSRIMRNITNECFEVLHTHSYNFFTSNFSGALVKRVYRASKAFEAIVDKLQFVFYPMGLRLLITIGVLSYIQPILGVIIFVWAILFMAINYALAVYKLKFDLERAAADTRITAELSDAIINNYNIKLFSAFNYEYKKFLEATLNWLRKTQKSWKISINIEGLQSVLMVALEIIMLYVAIKLWVKEVITIGGFFIIQAYILEMFNNLWDFGRSIREMYEKLADAEEMTEIIMTPQEVKDIMGAKQLKVINGKVEFKNVSFSYKKKGESVINNLNIKVKEGEKIALIGPSGGGKSTVVKLLLRLFDIQEGEILIDKQNIAKVTQDSLRRNVTLVPQDPILFHRSLMENIRYGRRSATKKEVIAAAKMAHCHEFIMKFKDGYDTFTGERGVKLSGGQRQRIAIARAILSNAKILILDEATSSLDSQSEVLIQKALKNLIKHKTTFIIAHRLSTIMSADRILVLKNGRIVEEGTHADLINKRGSLYNKLWNLQAGGYSKPSAV